MIEIIDTHIFFDENNNPIGRHADINIDNGVDFWALGVGGLPLSGDLQIVLDAQFDELWLLASQLQIEPNIYELRLKRVLKAFALVMLDEINILRFEHSLAARTASQIDNAIKVKMME